jgi:hypothetical protein
MDEKRLTKTLGKLGDAIREGGKSNAILLQTTTALANLANNIETLANEKASKTDPRLTNKRDPLPHIHKISDVQGLEVVLTTIKEQFQNLPQFYTISETDKLLRGIKDLTDEQKGEIDKNIQQVKYNLEKADNQLNQEIQEAVKALENKIEEVRAYRPEKIIEKVEVQREIAPPATIVNQVVDTIAIEKLKSDNKRLFQKIELLGANNIDTRKLEDDILKKIQEKVELKNQTLYITRNGIQRLDQLVDVDINTPVDGDVLTYDDTTQRWINQAGGGGTGTVTDVSVVTANGFSGTVANATTSPDITLTTSITGILEGNGTAISAASTTGTGSVVLSDNPTFTTRINTPEIKATSSAGVDILSNAGTTCALFGAGGGANSTFYGGMKGDYLTASTMLITDASKNIISAATATYPDLTELSYVKGVTSAIQTQLTGKLGTSLTSANIFVGNGSNIATGVAASGDVTLANTGAFTVAKIQSTTVSGTTGSGNVVFSTSPTLVTPALGTPVSGNLSNCTNITPTSYIGLVEMWNGNDITSSIGNNTYTIVLYAEYAMTINELKIIAGSGTCSAAVKINGTNVTGISAVSVSTTIATGTASAANSVSAGNVITLVLSSTSSLNNLQWTLKTTRA